MNKVDIIDLANLLDVATRQGSIYNCGPSHSCGGGR
ncbi:hypothetical protein EB18_00138 [Enterococcus cecorum]|uniref:Uncharacterized protein n=1 Tax=Enterococcus cecorum TaxID=44008 RepID=A0A366SK51_9ENTE|nr:hypothetical protein EB18_00138 [Enterococcus cecorum]